MRNPWVLMVVLAVLSACDSKPKQPPPDILKVQQQAMDKAKGVGGILQRSADERREQTDEAK